MQIVRFFLFLGFAGALVFSQDALNNDSVINMAKAGLSESVIITMITQQSGTYSTKLDDLIALRSLVAQGLEGAIVGKALYAQAFTLPEALDVAGRP